MHLAVCDDNIADRKQTERLLGRQSDRLFKECGERLYIDSYGNVEAFMQKPQMYHGLFIDMVNGEYNGFDVLKMLLYANITRPIIMCSSSIDYRSLAEKENITADNIIYIDKPIKVAELTDVIDRLKALCGKEEPTLELRDQNETIYAKGDDIIYARSARSSEVEIFLTGARKVVVIDDIVNFFGQCNAFPQITPVNDNCIINVNHIDRTSFMKVIMDDGTPVRVGFSYRHHIENALKKLKDLAT